MRPYIATIALVACMSACKFPELPPIDDDAVGADAVPVDASADAAPPCEAATIDCDDDTDVYTECSGQGAVALQFPCALGCAEDREQCIEFVPKNDVTAYLDQARDLPASLDIIFTGESTIYSGSATVLNAGISIDVPFALGPNGEGIYMFRSMVVAEGATLRIVGAPAILLAGRDVEIRGVLDVSANGETHGPGGRDCTFGDGAIGFGGNPPSAGPGAGGAGGSSSGGWGGRGGNGTDGAQGGAAGGPTTVPLAGGCRGGASTDGVSQTFGGAGGGAVQVTSRMLIRVVGQGAVDASGGGGTGALTTAQYGGSGGGSGGAIILEAPQIVLDGPGVAVSTKGGSGSASGTNASPTRHGVDGGYGPGPAPGGTAPGMPSGGAGGVDTGGQQGEAAPAGSLAGGGGGGSCGRTLIATRTGVINPQNGAAIRSNWTGVPLVTRFAP